MVAHHTIGGCDLNVGDLLGTGTISGQRKRLTWKPTRVDMARYGTNFS